MRYIDLTHPIKNGMTTAPVSWHPRVEITQMGRIHCEGSQTHKVLVGTHTGTHMDSPSHMLEGDHPYIDEIPLELCFGKAKMFTLPKEPFGKITAEDIMRSGIPVERGDRVIFNTGWHKEFNTPDFLRANPYFTPDAASFLVEKGVAMVCMDMPTPEDPRGPASEDVRNIIHRTFFRGGAVIVEYMANLDAVGETEFEFVILPLRLEGLDGSPVRAVAIVQ